MEEEGQTEGYMLINVDIASVTVIIGDLMMMLRPLYVSTLLYLLLQLHSSHHRQELNILPADVCSGWRWKVKH